MFEVETLEYLGVVEALGLPTIAAPASQGLQGHDDFVDEFPFLSSIACEIL